MRALAAVASSLFVLPTALASQDHPAGTVIVANMNANTVWFLDAATGERRGMFETHNDPHEVAVSSDGSLAAVTNYGGQDAAGNIIQIADVATARVVRELVIEGFERIHGVAFLPGDSLLVLTSERTGELLVVSSLDGGLRRAVSTGGRASHMLAPGGGFVYSANILDGSVARVDPTGSTETMTWSVGAARTEGVAATPDGSEGWTGSMESGVVVGVDGETGREVARIDGLQVPYRLAVTPDGRTVVVSDPGSGVLGLIDRGSNELRTVDIGAAAAAHGLAGDPSPQGFTLSRDGRWAFVSSKGVDRVAVVDLTSAEVTAFHDAGAGPDGIAFSPVR